MSKIEFSDDLVKNNTVLQQLWQHKRANNLVHDTDTLYIYVTIVKLTYLTM